MSPPTLSLLTAADWLDSGFPTHPPGCPLLPNTLPFLPVLRFRRLFPEGDPANRPAARVDLSGAVAIKNSPVSGAWIADGTSTPYNFPSSRWQSLAARDSREGTTASQRELLRLFQKLATTVSCLEKDQLYLSRRLSPQLLPVFQRVERKLCPRWRYKEALRSTIISLETLVLCCCNTVYNKHGLNNQWRKCTTKGQYGISLDRK